MTDEDRVWRHHCAGRRFEPTPRIRWVRGYFNDQINFLFGREHRLCYRDRRAYDDFSSGT
jgi:hypothetical protein